MYCRVVVSPRTGLFQRRVMLTSERILGMRFLRADIRANGERALRAAARRAAGKLVRAGGRRLVLPPELPEAEAFPGLSPVTAGPLFEALAARMALRVLREMRIGAEGTCVGIAAERASVSAERLLLSLAVSVRHLSVEMPAGADAFADRMARARGLSLRLGASALAACPVVVALSPVEAAGEGTLLWLCQAPPPAESARRILSGARLALREEPERLPGDADAVMLLAALWEGGAVETEEIRILEFT